MSSLLPKSTVQVRPRTAVEIRPEGVYAARADDAAGLLAATASALLPADALLPSLRAGNVADRGALIGALKKTLGAVQQGKSRSVTLIVPDTAVRVLLLDFDELPSKAEEALPIIRFRLAKLLPFSPDQAQISWQVMSRHSILLQVLVVAIPSDVLAEYESAVREAGFEPGAVLPSTLAIAAGIEEVGQAAALLVNASEFAATTAILRRGELLLHRTLELKASPVAEAVIVDAESHTALVQTVALTEAEQAERASLELLQAISVAAAYFEDSLAIAPVEVLVAGTLSASALSEMIAETGIVARDVVQSTDLLGGTAVPRGLLAGLRGALKS